MQDQPSIRTSHNLFLHRFVDNDQTKSVTLMRLDTHSTLYRQGVENKYLTNLVVSGRNFIELYAIFQNQLTLSMGIWHIYEDILQVQQWEKNIVITTKNKVVGLIYDDCMVKNSFMLTLDFLELGFRQQIQTVCDKSGYYMVVATNRQILLCVSQKAVHRYKAKPFMHRKMSIIEEKVIWNRPEYQSIVDVVKFEYYDFDLAKVEGFHFCDQYLYFMGYTNKIGNKKMLFQVPIEPIFSDNEKESLILEFTKLDDDVRESYVIRRETESQFLIIKKNNTILIKNQKGQFAIEEQLFKKNPKAEMSQQQHFMICKKSSNPVIFPLHLYYKNCVYTWERVPTLGLSIPGYFSKRVIKLPEDLQVEYCDIQDGLFTYCNLYETGLIFLKNSSSSKQGTMVDEKEQKLTKIVLKEYFGNIIDFNIGQNILIIENSYQKKCNIKLLRKAILQSSKPFIMVPKKIALEKIQNIKTIRSLEDLLSEYEMSESDQELKRVREFLLGYLVIQTKNDIFNLYKLVAGPNYELVLSGLAYWTLVKDYSTAKDHQKGYNSWYLLLWTAENELLHYKIPVQENPPPNTLILVKTIPNIRLSKTGGCQIYRIKQHLVSVCEQDLQLWLYNWKKNTFTTVKLSGEVRNPAATIVRLNYKSITFKKKDKDYYFLEVVALLDGERIKIWEVSMDSGLSKPSHCTENVGEGLAILLPSESPVLNSVFNLSSHQFRALSCPEYVLSDKTINNSSFKSPRVIKMHILQYEAQNYLFLINSKEELQLYKKIYCSNSNVNSTFGNIDTGFLYYRQPLQLNMLKKFKYNEATAFVDIGCGMLRLCNLVFFKGGLLQLQENIRSCFRISEDETWSILSDNKIKPLVNQGKMISHYLTTTIPSKQSEQILSIESTNQNYIIYSRNTFEVFDKELNITWSELNNPQDAILENNEFIISLCAFDHYVAVSYYNYCLEEGTKDEYKSIKFKLRVYNTITKKKIIEKENAYEEPVLHIRYVAPDKLIVVTSSNISINTIKNNLSLENPRNKHYSKRAMLSCFSYHPEKVGIEPGYMLFGGLYGGLSFHVGQWIDKDKLDQMWFENLKCGLREAQIFHYGDSTEMLKAVIADDSENLIVLDLKPKSGDKIADFHIGSPVNSIKKRNEIPYIASEDGCIRALFPIKLKDPQISFLDFQDEITKSIPELGGFNNHESRLLDQRKKTYKIISEGNIVDGQVIRSFFSLTQVLKNNIYEASDITLENLKNQLLAYL